VKFVLLTVKSWEKREGFLATDTENTENFFVFSRAFFFRGCPCPLFVAAMPRHGIRGKKGVKTATDSTNFTDEAIGLGTAGVWDMADVSITENTEYRVLSDVFSVFRGHSS
jgi:hypothetical protein